LRSIPDAKQGGIQSNSGELCSKELRSIPDAKQEEYEKYSGCKAGGI